jgi:tetratricopeptide (TPR) repeat protein
MMWWIAGLGLLIVVVFRPTKWRRCAVQIHGAQNALQRRDWPTLRRRLELGRSAAARLKEPKRAHFLGHIALLAARADYREGRFSDCEEHLTEAAGYIERAQFPDRHLQIAEVHRLRGDLCFDAGTTSQAVDCFRDAVASDQTSGNDAMMIFDLQRLSDVLLGERRFDEAKIVIERAVELERKVTVAGLQKDGKDPGTLTIVSMSMPDLALAAGDWANAEKLFREKVEHWSKMVTGPDNIDVSRYQFHLAAAQSEQGRHADAVGTLRRACETVQRDFGADHPRMARALEKLARALSAAGDESEAAMTGKQADALRGRSEP